MKILLFLFLFLSNSAVFAQSTSSLSGKELQSALEIFERYFKAAIEQDFDSISVQKFKLVDHRLFIPSGFNEEIGYTYLLSDYLDKPYFKQVLERLFNSDDIEQQQLAFCLIMGAGAKAYETPIWERLKSKEQDQMFYVHLSILLYLRTSETTALFDLLLEQKLPDGVLWRVGLMMGNLDKDALRATAYQRINTADDLEKKFAISLLAYTGQNKKTNALLLDGLKTWDEDTKEQAIYVLKELKVGNLLNELKPLLQNPKLNQGILEALANSPTKEDLNYLKQTAAAQTPISKELLNTFCQSSNIDVVRYWLELLRTKELTCYVDFSARRQPLLMSDALLADLQRTIVEIKDPMLLRRLMELLRGRTDERSVQILMGLLKHENRSVRSVAISALIEHYSLELEKELILFLNEDKVCADRLIVNWLIQHKVEGLHRTFERFYEQEGINGMCHTTALKYLANFPKPSYLKLFKTILKDPESKQLLKRLAILGISQLKDKRTLGFLIESCAEEKDNVVIVAYLRVLKEMKSPKAKAFIGRYKNSKYIVVRRLVFETLRD